MMQSHKQLRGNSFGAHLELDPVSLPRSLPHPHEGVAILYHVACFMAMLWHSLTGIRLIGKSHTASQSSQFVTAWQRCPVVH